MSEFYTSIAPYYSAIFPLQNKQVPFCEKLLKDKWAGNVIVDAGCATGELAFALAEKGSEVFAFDPDGEMISIAKHKDHSTARFTVNGIDSFSFQDDAVDLITCFGNTVAHLSESELIQSFTKFAKMLKAGGVLALQLLNYQYIIAENITVLPKIKQENLLFERYYEFADTMTEAVFITRLTLFDENRTIDNSVLLYPHRETVLRTMLQKAGFVNVEAYGGFGFEPCTGQQLPLVLVARC